MNYYIQGDHSRAKEIKAAFEKLGYNTNVNGWNFNTDSVVYFTNEADKSVDYTSIETFVNLIKTHPDYQELELPVEPKFKVGDRISWKDPDSGDPTDVCRIMQLLDKEQLYMVDKEHGVSYISYASQDYYELAPQFPQFKKGDLVCVEGALLGRVTDDHGKWYEIGGVLYNKKVVTIATQEDIDRIVGKGDIDVTV